MSGGIRVQHHLGYDRAIAHASAREGRAIRHQRENGRFVSAGHRMPLRAREHVVHRIREEAAKRGADQRGGIRDAVTLLAEPGSFADSCLGYQCLRSQWA